MKPINSKYLWYEKSPTSPFPFILCGGCYKTKHNITYVQYYFTSKQPYHIKRLQYLSLSDNTLWPLVRKRTIPTDRPPLVSEVSANFLRTEGIAWSVQWIPTAVNIGFLDWSRYFSIQVAPQLSSRGWVDPVPDPLLLRKSGSAGNRKRDLWICSQELWPLDQSDNTMINNNVSCHISSFLES
jgi:hypothetical protein